MRLASGHGRDRAGATGWKLQKASPIPNLVLSLEALAGFCGLFSLPSTDGLSHTGSSSSALAGKEAGMQREGGAD